MAIWSRRRDKSKRFGRQLRKQSKQLRVQRLEDRLALSAEPVGDAFLVNDFTAGAQSADSLNAAVAASAVNRVVVYEGRGPSDPEGVYAKIYDAQGAALGDAIRVNTTIRGAQYGPSVAVQSDGDFIVVWAGRGIADKSGIFLQRFESDGTRVGDEVIVNTTLGGVQTAPDIAVNNNGSFVVTWEGAGRGDSSGVFFRRFNAEGALGTEARANTTTANHQSSASVAYLTTGEFVIGWQSLGQDGSEWNIQSQIYNSVGLPVGNELLLNSTTESSQIAPSLSADPNGGFVAAWQSHAQDGDGWGIVGRRFAGDGNAAADEMLLNEETDGAQVAPAIAVASDGQWLVAWSSNSTTGAGYDIVTRSIEADGTANLAAVVQTGVTRSNGRGPSVSIVGTEAVVVASGMGTRDSDGTVAQAYTLTLGETPENVAPDLAPISDRDSEVGNVVEVVVTATDANAGNTLTFTLDTDNSPAGATITQTNNNRAIVRWTPSAADDGTTVGFRVVVTDNGNPVLSDAETFMVEVADAPLSVDLNGPDSPGNVTDAVFIVGDAALQAVAPQLVISGASDGLLQGAMVSLFLTPDGAAEILSVQTDNTSITANYDATTRRLTLSGEDTVENYQQVLRTLIYSNSNPDASGGRQLGVRVTDADGQSPFGSTLIQIIQPDLVGLAKALDAAGAKLYGRASSPATTAQRELFDDGAQFLDYTEISDAPAGLNLTNEVTWIVGETRVEGLQTLFRLAQIAEIEIPTSTDPFVAPIADQTLLVGSPLHLALDGYDSNGGPLTYEVEVTGNADVSAEILSGNRSIRFNIAGDQAGNVHDYGDLTFELFEQRAPRATARMIALAEADFYDGLTFHRIVNDFAIQGGDPNGDGTGGSSLGNFDDQFDIDLQHNRTGLLSMAKSSDDTNNSQFFITEGDNTPSLRNLDFNHTIFGLLTEGELARAAISDSPVEANPNTNEVSVPVNDINISDAEVFTDTENATLFLKAAEGATGTATITVTVRDEDGNSSQQSFEVNLTPDTVNSRPFLEDIPPVTSPSDTPAQFQLTGVDVEDDPIFYAAQAVGDEGHTVEVDDNGLVTVTPPAGFVGTLRVAVAASRVEGGADDVQFLDVQFT